MCMSEGYSSYRDKRSCNAVYRAINRGKAIYRVSTKDMSDRHSMSKIPSVCLHSREEKGDSYLEISNIFIHDSGRVVTHVNVNELKWKFLEVQIPSGNFMVYRQCNDRMSTNDLSYKGGISQIFVLNK